MKRFLAALLIVPGIVLGIALGAAGPAPAQSIFSSFEAYNTASGLAAPFETLDPVNLGPGLTLTNNTVTANPTATMGPGCGVNDGSMVCWTRSLHNAISGKYYVEFSDINDGSGYAPAYNIQTGALSLTNTDISAGTLGYNQTDNSCGATTGLIQVNGTNMITGLPGFCAGKKLAYAIDFTNKLFWAHVIGQPWNGNAASNPANGASDCCGVNIAAAITSGPFYVAMGLLNYGAVQTSVNFGATAYAGTVPAGFSNWPTASVPPVAVTSVSPNTCSYTGCSGVVITGTNFDVVTAVKFGTVAAASYTVNSTTQITAAAPAATFNQTVDITVTGANGTSLPAGSDQFTYTGVPATTYYITAAAANSYNGTTDTGSGTLANPWQTINHTVLKCGDTVLLEPGTYTGMGLRHGNAAPGDWPVTNCSGAGTTPYVIVKCDATTIQACLFVANNGTNDVLQPDTPYWAIIGFTGIANCTYPMGNIGSVVGSCYGSCFVASSHHILYINNYAHDCTWSGGGPAGYNTITGAYGNAGSGDYVAYIGHLSLWNSWQSVSNQGGCPSNMSSNSMTPLDLHDGTHLFYAGLFSIASGSYATCVDGHGYIADSWNQQGFSVKAVFEQFLMIGNAVHGLYWFNSYSANGVVKFGTLWGNHAFNSNTAGPCGGGGELTFSTGSGAVVGAGGGVTHSNMIIQSTETQQQIYCYSTGGGTFPVYAVFVSGLPAGHPLIQYTDYLSFGGNANFCDTSNLTTGCNASGSWTVTFGSGNLNTDPGFTSPSVPADPINCSTYATVTACLQGTGLIGVAGGAAGKFTPTATAVATGASDGGPQGYRPPGPCAVDPDWPHWVPISLIPSGLVTMPCTQP